MSGGSLSTDLGSNEGLRGLDACSSITEEELTPTCRYQDSKGGVSIDYFFLKFIFNIIRFVSCIMTDVFTVTEKVEDTTHVCSESFVNVFFVPSLLMTPLQRNRTLWVSTHPHKIEYGLVSERIYFLYKLFRLTVKT